MEATITEFRPRLIAFCCENSGLMAAHMAGKMELGYPETVELIKLPCAGKMDVLYFLKALEKGADGVMLIICPEDSCKYINGNTRALQRLEQAQKLLKEVGIEEERLSMAFIAANRGPQFVERVRAFYSRLLELGENPGKVRQK